MRRDAVLASFDALLKTHIEHSIETSIERVNVFIEEFQELNDTLSQELGNDPSDHKKIFSAAKNYQQRKINRINNKYAEINKAVYEIDLENLRLELRKLLNKTPKRLRREQKRSRFYIESGDVGIVRSIKRSKRFLYRITSIPTNAANFIRRYFKKKDKKMRYWKYKIPYRKLITFQIENNLVYRFTDILNELIEKNVVALKNILDQEQSINSHLIEATLPEVSSDFNFETLRFDYLGYQSEFRNNLNRYRRAVTKLLYEYNGKIQDLENIAGTMEYPGLYLSYKNRKKNKEKVFKRFQAVNQNWGNTIFGLFEDWKIDQEIYNLNYFTRSKIDLVKKDFVQTNQDVVELIEKNRCAVSDFHNRLIPMLSSKPSDQKKIIRQELDTLDRTISKKIFEQSIELIVNHNLPERINQFELKIQNFLKEIADKRWLTKLTRYDTPIKQSDLSSFSPRELIDFEYLSELRDSCGKLKFRIIQHIEKLQHDINNIESIISFNLSSIIESIDREESKPLDVPELASEGLERSKNKIEEIINSVSLFEKEILEALEGSIVKFSDSVTKLTVNENAFNLRMLLAKAKTLKRTEDISEQFLSRFKVIREKINVIGRTAIIKAEKLILPWRKRIGLDEADAEIATELSDFLQEANQKINNLPLIYQRLYKISPLTEMSLFTGRTHELEQLVYAYRSWQEGKYSPTVLLGEKWSGHTTLINYFIDTHLEKDNVLYENRFINITSETAFIEAWKNILNEKNIEKSDDIFNIINRKHQGKVIIIENIQNYYLRTFHGFENLQRMIKLVAKTHKKVFWLFSANTYAWHYLNKTSDLAGYFGYQIKMNAFNDDELKELIMKKNNISGYKIRFKPSEKNLNNKKFIRLAENDQQEFLRNQFFYELNAFARGNISLALTYWLLSTQEISDEAIDILNFDPPDFSFVRRLNSEKVFIIYLLIMHDGLTLEQLYEVYKMPEEKLQMLVIMLHDDGILIEKNQWYEINPMIYRQCINMLKSKNLIY